MAKLKEGSIILKTDGEKLIATKDEIPTIIDNLTSTSTTATLSANQGKVLNDKIDAAIQAVATLDSSGKVTATQIDTITVESIPLTDIFDLFT